MNEVTDTMDSEAETARIAHNSRHEFSRELFVQTRRDAKYFRLGYRHRAEESAELLTSELRFQRIAMARAVIATFRSALSLGETVEGAFRIAKRNFGLDASGPPLVDAEALLEKLCHLINDEHVYKQEAIALLNDALGARAMTEVQALTACKHGKPTCGECLEEAPLELLRLNPFARHDIENKPPTDPAGAFIFGIRYYAGMLEDGDSWGHSLGHIESLCRDFQNAIDDRAGKPRRFPVTDDALDAPDGAIVNGYQRSGDQWIKLPDEVVTLRARVAELEAMTPAEFERRSIARAIETHRTCRKAAKALGIGKATLYRRIQRGEFTLPPRVLKGSEP